MTTNCLGGDGKNKDVNDKARDLAERYQKRRDEVLQSSTEEGTSVQGSPSTSVNKNQIYLGVVGGKYNKWNVYGLGTLSKRLSCSKSAQVTQLQAPTVEQFEEMHDTIKKLNEELMTKTDKEKTLEDKMTQLMQSYDQQTEQMRQQMQAQNKQIR